MENGFGLSWATGIPRSGCILLLRHDQLRIGGFLRPCLDTDSVKQLALGRTLCDLEARLPPEENCGPTPQSDFNSRELEFRTSVGAKGRGGTNMSCRTEQADWRRANPCSEKISQVPARAFDYPPNRIFNFLIKTVGQSKPAKTSAL